MTSTARAELMLEIELAASRLEAPAAIVSLIGGWETGCNDQAVLAGLRKWNDEKQGGPYQRRPHAVDHAIITEIYNVIWRLDAPRDLLRLLSTWGGEFDDAETLAAVKRYNRQGSTLDH